MKELEDQLNRLWDTYTKCQSDAWRSSPDPNDRRLSGLPIEEIPPQPDPQATEAAFSADLAVLHAAAALAECYRVNYGAAAAECFKEGYRTSVTVVSHRLKVDRFVSTLPAS